MVVGVTPLDIVIFMYSQRCRSRGGGGAISPSVFGRSVNPILTREADYAHHITTAPPPFLDGAASLIVKHSATKDGGFFLPFSRRQQLM